MVLYYYDNIILFILFFYQNRQMNKKQNTINSCVNIIFTVLILCTAIIVDAIF